MQSRPTLFLVFLGLCLCSSVTSSREVTLSCGADEEAERGPAGPPGKRGVQGETGPKGESGEKGDRGQTDESEEQIMALEQRVQDLEFHLQHGLVQTLSASLRRDCNDVSHQGFTRSGIYNISIDGRGGIFTEVYCDLEANGGDWLVIQRRVDGATDFFLGWNSYVNGFGDLSHEFWLGLENLHRILSNGRTYQLRVDVEDFERNRAYALYSSFSVGSSDSNYQLKISGYSGDAGDSLALHNNGVFSTHDRDHDDWENNCAQSYHGAWWYRSCHHSNLNGNYLLGGQVTATGINWRSWKTTYYSMKRAEMKIRSIN